MAKKKTSPANVPSVADYRGLLGEVVSLLEAARRTSARAVNAVMTATYWEIGRRIVEVEQQGSAQAEYGDELIKRLAADLMSRFGRGFGWRNVYQMRALHLAYPNILQALSAKSGDPKQLVIWTCHPGCDPQWWGLVDRHKRRLQEIYAVLPLKIGENLATSPT